MKVEDEIKKNQEEVGRLLRSRRAYIGLSQKTVADHLKVNQAYISLIESGERKSSRIISEIEAYYRQIEEGMQKNNI